MIELDKVSYTYPAAAGPALQDISLSIPEGQFCALIGVNGAGKSTLAYTIAGFVPHFYHGTLTGKVTVANLDTQTTLVPLPLSSRSTLMVFFAVLGETPQSDP